MDIIVKYIDELLEKSTPAAPMWNIEKIRDGGVKSNWNYIDGVMIKAVLQMYDVTKDEKYLKFADDFIDYRVHEDIVLVRRILITSMQERHYLSCMILQEKKSIEKLLILYTHR